MNRYQIILAGKYYRELRDQLAGHVEERSMMHDDHLVLVDEVGRSVVENRLPGRIRWESHTVPPPSDRSPEAFQERARLHMERRRKAGLEP